MAKSQAERRTTRRLSTSAPVNVRHMRRQLMGTARDISPSGMFLISEARIEDGADIEVVLMMPQELRPKGGRWMSCHAKVVRVEEQGKDGEFGIAAKIIYCESVDVL